MKNRLMRLILENSFVNEGSLMIDLLDYPQEVAFSSNGDGQTDIAVPPFLKFSNGIRNSCSKDSLTSPKFSNADTSEPNLPVEATRYA